MAMFPDREKLTQAQELVSNRVTAAARLWTAFKVLAIIGAIITALVYVTNDTRLSVISTLTQQHEIVAKAEAKLSSQVRPIISQAYSHGAVPTVEVIKSVERKAQEVINALAAFNPPDDTIRKASIDLKAAIEALLGSINSYDASLGAYQRFQNAAVLSANEGGELKDQVSLFTSGTWRSFWGSI